MRHWYHVARHNENVMALCINVIHHMVLTFERYLMNHQNNNNINPFPTFFLGNLCRAGPVVSTCHQNLAIILCLGGNALMSMHNCWGPDALAQSFLAQISLWNNFLFPSGNLLIQADKKIVPCELSWKYTTRIRHGHYGGERFSCLSKELEKSYTYNRCNILIFYKRHIHGYKVPLESIFFFLNESSHFFVDLKHMISTNSTIVFMKKKIVLNFARFQFLKQIHQNSTTSFGR
jgi:hypothetical protein